MGAEHTLRNKIAHGLRHRRRRAAAQPQRARAVRPGGGRRGRARGHRSSRGKDGVRAGVQVDARRRDADRQRRRPATSTPSRCATAAARPRAGRTTRWRSSSGSATDSYDARQRRPDLQDQDRRAPTERLRLQLLRLGRSTPTRRTSTRSTTSSPTARRSCATIGDYRQLNDALVPRRARTRAPRTSTRTRPNRLHFYVVDKHTDAERHAALHRRRPVARRRRPADARRVAGRRAARAAPREGYTTCTFTLTNTGAAAATDPAAAPAGRDGVAQQRHLPALGVGHGHRLDGAPAATRSRRRKFGETVTVPVYVSQGAGAAPGSVTLTATSESDPTKTADRDLRADATATVGGTVPATLALTLGTPASFGAFTPGVAQGLHRHARRRTSSRPPVTRR